MQIIGYALSAFGPNYITWFCFERLFHRKNIDTLTMAFIAGILGAIVTLQTQFAYQVDFNSLVAFVVMFLMSCCYREPWIQRLFVSFVLFVCGVISEGSSWLIGQMIIPVEDMNHVNEAPHFAFVGLLSVVFQILYVIVMMKIMKKLSQGIASWLCRCKELSEFSAEIQYAVHQILWDLSTFILSLICLQLIYSDIQSGLLFAALFLPLHCVVGGAHAQTRLKCVSITILMFIICAYYCHEDTMPFITILSMLSWLFIWKFAPTAAQNHIMTIQQKKKNRKLTHHILLLYLLLTILSQKMNIIAVVNSIQISLIIIAILMFACSAYDSDWPHFSQHSWKKQLPQAVLGLCLLICHNTVNMTSCHWEYQDELSDDLRRKFDNI